MLQEEIFNLLKNGASLFLIGPTDSGKSWFIKNNLLPFLTQKGLRGIYFTDCNEIPNHGTIDLDFSLVDEVESLQDQKFLEAIYLDKKPYYSKEYLQKVKTWFNRLSSLKIPSLYIISRNSAKEIKNFSECVKTADWDGRKVEILFFNKENRVS